MSQHPDRPDIICHMMSTIDGKITSGTGVDILEGYFSLYTQTEDTFAAKSWILGRVTMQMFADDSSIPLPLSDKKIDDTDFLVSPQSEYYMFGIDTKGLVRWKSNTITLTNVTEKLNLVIVVTGSTPKEYLAYLQEKNISYVMAGADAIDFALLLQKIKQQFQIQKLLLEGGGILNGSLMTIGVVDEISILVTPLVVNRSAAPAVFENKNTSELSVKNYSLIDAKKMSDDVVWLRYRMKENGEIH